jgi:hypothetical protein
MSEPIPRDPSGQEPEETRLTPELREWILKQIDEEVALAELQELMEKGGLEFHQFVQELEQIVDGQGAHRAVALCPTR